MRTSDSDTALPGFERSLAVVIGINSYSHGIPPLLNAVRDADAIADSLERQGFEVLRFLDAEATLASLTHLLSHHLPSLPEPPDRLLIYFAGHGLAHTDDKHQFSGFLLPSDAHRDDTSSYWPMASLREALSHLSCRHLLLILDCCFAGAFPHAPSRDLRPLSQPAPLYLERFRHFSSRRSFQLLLSTTHDELASDRLLTKPSQETLGDGLHSPFALALLEGLQSRSPADTNQDGLLTAAELYTFLRDRLLSLLPSHHQQTPSLWHLDWHDSGEFLFLLSDSFPSLPPAAPLSQHSNPYLGLRPFAAAHRHLFFGRERLVGSLLERLRAQPLLLLCGPSGAGKSSLVHAGLLPRLSEDASWRVPPSLRPSSQPLHALSAWLDALAPGASPPSASTLASRPRAAAQFLTSFLAHHPERSVLLVIDPLEELVTACLDDALRRAFLRALSGLLSLSHPRLRLLLLLRSDFEPHFLSLLQPCAIPSGLWHGGRLDLPPMNRDELRRCIEKPAEACVLFFSPGLVERLLDDVEQMPGALPLLSVALSELFNAYLASGRSDRTLSFDDYRHIGGGIAGALQRRAELVFSGLPPPSCEGQPALPPVPPSELPAFQRTLRNVLLRMVAPEGGELARRRVPRSELEYPHRKENARVQRALRTLEASRLVVASDDGGPCVEPAHDALLSAWPRLHDWARHAQRELLLLRRISHAASEWHRHRRTHDFLWADARLDQLGLAPASLRRTNEPLALPTLSVGSQSTEPLSFNAAESGFLRASATRRSFLRTRRNVLALTVAMMLVALTVAALFQANKANVSARQAEIQQRAAEHSAEEARQQKEAAEHNAIEAKKQQRIAGINADEAQRQQGAAEAHLKEARKQQEAADANARRAQQQQEVAEANAREAQRQQQLADANAQEALTQRNTAEVNAKEAQRQKEAAEANAREAQRQQQLADANAEEALTQRNTSEANAAEARKQQKAAEANLQEAQRQQRSADTNAQEARKQQQVAEDNYRDARKQQRLADANAREALAQRNTAEANARETLKQKDLALARARLIQAERLIEEDPTRALLVLLEASNPRDSLGNSWLHTALEISHRALSRTIMVGQGDRMIAGQFGPAGNRIDEMNAIRFSPDGSTVIIVSSDGTVRICRTDGSAPPTVLTRGGIAVAFASFSPDGTHVLIASGDGSSRIWRTDGSRPPVVLTGHTAELTSASFSPDGAHVLTTSNDGAAHLWRSDSSGPPIALSGHTERVTSANFSPDGSRFLSVFEDGTARIWRTDGSGPPVVLTEVGTEVASASFSPDSAHVLIASNNGTARIWRADGAGPPVVLTTTILGIWFASFSPDSSRILFVSGDDTAHIWHTDGSGPPIVLTGHTAGLTSASFSPDGSRVLTTSNDGTARIWHTDGSGPSIVLTGHTAGLTSASFSPDGSRVLTAFNDGTARIWRADGSGMPIVLTGHTSEVTSASFSPDGSQVLTASNDGTVRIWRTDGFSTPIPLTGHTGEVMLARVSPDSSRVFIASTDGIPSIWRADGSGMPILLTGHTGKILFACFSPDSSRILTVSDDAIARIWRTDGIGSSVVLRGMGTWVRSASFSPDNSHVLIVSDDSVARIWRTEGSSGPSAVIDYPGKVMSASFSPDSSHVLTTSSDNIARIWRIDGTGIAIAFTGPTGWITTASFSPDGSHVLAASNDGTARIWRTDGTGTPIILTSNTVEATFVRFSPDGSRVFALSNYSIPSLWRADGSGAPIVLSTQPDGATSAPLDAGSCFMADPAPWMEPVNFSPDSSRILTVARDGVPYIWRTDGSSTPAILAGHKAQINSASFSSDGSLVLTASLDGTIHIWRMDEQTPPLILRHNEVSQTLFGAFILRDGSRVVTLSRDGRLRVWPITPELLRDYLQNITTVCLSINERERYLLESFDEARRGHERCERSHGRLP